MLPEYLPDDARASWDWDNDDIEYDDNGRQYDNKIAQSLANRADDASDEGSLGHKSLVGVPEVSDAEVIRGQFAEVRKQTADVTSHHVDVLQKWFNNVTN